MKNTVMLLQSISPCPSGFGEYQLTLGSSEFKVNTGAKFRRVKKIEGKVHYGGYCPVVVFGDENSEPWNGDLVGIFVWLNATERRLNAVRKSGQMVEDTTH